MVGLCEKKRLIDENLNKAPSQLGLQTPPPAGSRPRGGDLRSRARGGKETEVGREQEKDHNPLSLRGSANKKRKQKNE